MISTASQTTIDEVLRAADRLAPGISARAAEVEQARELPGDLLRTLVDSGCFRTLLPERYGGLGADLPAALRVVGRLSRADGAVGWTVMIGGASWIDLAGLELTAFERLFAGGPDVMIAGVFSPAGKAMAAGGGYRVNGRWGFASGCRHADWLYGNCIEEVADGVRLRSVLFRPGDVAIEDSWQSLGLRGTGSHHFHADGVVVPADRSWLPMEDEACVEAPIVRIPPASLFALSIATVAIGIAKGALDDVRAQALSKVPLLAGAPLATSPTFQRDLATAHSETAASQALIESLAAEAWETVLASELSLDQRARIRGGAALVASRAADAVTTAYRAGGGSAVYLDNPLQRRLRDVHTLTQHFLVRADTLTTAGAILAGQPMDLPVF